MNRLVIALCALVMASSSKAAPPIALPEQAAASTPAARTVCLTRDGHYAAAPGIDEKIGPALSPVGVAQAKLAGARIAASTIAFDGLNVSPMQRLAIPFLSDSGGR